MASSYVAGWGRNPGVLRHEPWSYPKHPANNLAREVTLGERGPDGLQMCEKQLQGGERGRTCSHEPHVQLSVT